MAVALSGAPPCSARSIRTLRGTLTIQGFGQNDLNLAVLDGAPDAVRTEHQPVAHGEPQARRAESGLKAIDVALTEHTLAPERAEHLVAVRVPARLLGSEDAAGDHRRHQRMISGQLGEHTVSQQVRPGVADVGERQLAAVDGDTGDRRAELATLRGGVDGGGRLLHEIYRIQPRHDRRSVDVSACGQPSTPRRMGKSASERWSVVGDESTTPEVDKHDRTAPLHHHVNGGLAGDLASLHPAHAVGDTEQRPSQQRPPRQSCDQTT